MSDVAGDGESARRRIRTGTLVLGAGVSGCSSAHYLSRDAAYMAAATTEDERRDPRVVLLERNPSLGGIARSGVIAHTGTRGRSDLPTEYSWRVFGSDYVVCDDILRDIRGAGSGAGATAADNLTPISDPYWFVAYATAAAAGVSLRVWSELSSMWRYVSAFRGALTFGQQWHLLDCLLYGLSCSRERRTRQLSRQTWSDFVRPMPAAAEPFLVRFLAPVLGVDMNAASASSVLEYLEHWWTPADNRRGATTRVARMPTSDAWFEPWHRQLLARGVDVRVDSTVTRLVADASGRRIARAECVLAGVPCAIEAEHYVCALPIEAVAAVLPPDYPARQQFARLATIMRQDMVGVQLYWRQPVLFDMPRTGVFLNDSPWQLLIEPQGVFWSSPDPATATATATTSSSSHRRRTDDIGARYGDGTVHDIWSITLCDSVRPGFLLGKRWRDCTRPEIFAEVWHQLTRSDVLVGGCRGADGTSLDRLQVRAWHLWASWQPDRNGTLDTWEPKSSPNAGSLLLRPPAQSHYENLLFGAVWAQSSKEMQRMETAAENGAAAARVILERQRQTAPHTGAAATGAAAVALPPVRHKPPRAFPVVFGPVRVLDRVMLALGLPHPSAIFCGSSTLLMLAVLLLGLAVLCDCVLFAFSW